MIPSNVHTGILHFESFLPFDQLVHFTTTRQGGVSISNFESFNLGNYSEDSAENINENRKTLCKSLNFSKLSLITPHQIHDDKILIIDDNFFNLSFHERKDTLVGKDAIITSLKQIYIAVTTADCVPVLLFSPEKKVIGAVHAGWRGTVKRILQKTVSLMIDHYNCNPMRIYAAIGPSIGVNAFEVGNEVYEAFQREGFYMPSISFVHPETAKYHIDLWEANRQQLIHCGIPGNQIEISGLCTYSQPERFFSARRLGIASGRMLTGIGIKA